MKILSNFYSPVLEEFDIVLFNGNSHDESYFSHQPTMLFSQVIANLPEGWEPDLVLFHTPFYYKIPIGIENSPWPTVAVLDDWFGGVDFMPDVLGWFDHIVTDLYSLDLLEERGFTNCSYWASFGHDHRRFNTIEPSPPRDIDIAFVGNLNGNIQYERFSWLKRAALITTDNTKIGTGIFGDDYVETLNRAKIGFNRSIKGEMNLRCFEVPACGALLFIEEENREVRQFLEPQKECILYNDSNLEELLLYYLTNDDERETIAAAGKKRIDQHRFVDNYRNLIKHLKELNLTAGSGRSSRGFYSTNSDHLHLIQTALGGAGQDPQLLNRITHFLQTPGGQEPLFLNDMAVLLANYGETAALDHPSRITCYRQAHDLFDAVLQRDPQFYTAKFNLMQMKTRLNDPVGAVREAYAICEINQNTCSGLIFPLNYTFPLRYLWNQALAEPDQFRRIDLLHYFARFTAADMYEQNGEPNESLKETIHALEIYRALPYGVKKLSRLLRKMQREELFEPWIETAMNASPFDGEIVLCAISALEKCGDPIPFVRQVLSMMKSLTEKTIQQMPGVKERLAQFSERM